MALGDIFTQFAAVLCCYGLHLRMYVEIDVDIIQDIQIMQK